MQIFLPGIAGVILGIGIMHVISTLFLRKDEKKRQIQYKKLNIKLNEKCAIILRLYSEQKQIPEALVEEVEDLIFELSDLAPYAQEIKITDTPEILLETLENPVCIKDIRQSFAAGRIYSSLKFLYSL